MIAHVEVTIVPRDEDVPPESYMSGNVPAITWFGAATLNLGALSDPEDYLHDLAHRCLALASDVRRARDIREPAAHHYDALGMNERKASEVHS